MNLSEKQFGAYAAQQVHVQGGFGIVAAIKKKLSPKPSSSGFRPGVYPGAPNRRGMP